ncbi:hypothetical protein ABPG72_005078 [Tetrahymena utriculariae]
MEDNYAADVQRQFNRTAFDSLYKICYNSLVQKNGSSIDFQKQIDCHQRLINVFAKIAPIVVKVEQDAVSSGGAAAGGKDDE